jgi:catechol 2,3-dioxygenase-like lactoylglutathione lyase family enzyme
MMRVEEEGLMKVKDVQYVTYRVPDLDLIERFLTDFGMVRASRTPQALEMRGAGDYPVIYRAELAPKAGFAHVVFEGPEAAVLKDPDGYEIRVASGVRKVKPLPMRAALEMNNPARKVRLNGTQRPPAAPAPVLRMGHLVFKVTDIGRSIKWYEKELGMKLSDSVYEGDETKKLIAFMRCDRGAEHTDHHTVGLAQIPPGAPLGVHHTSFETLDLDAIGMGSEWLKAQGWEKQHVWGIGRHFLGSQVFDYWRDPFGNMIEHFADGDLFDAFVPSGAHPIGKESLYMWGPAVPQEFMQ